MDFFTFLPDHGIAMGPNSWIFLLTWLPLTFITIAIYYSVVSARLRVKAELTNETSKAKDKACEPVLTHNPVATGIRDSLAKLRKRLGVSVSMHKAEPDGTV